MGEMGWGETQVEEGNGRRKVVDICKTLNKGDFKNKIENIEMKRVKISEQ